jgi:AraC family transcriptional regulator
MQTTLPTRRRDLADAAKAILIANPGAPHRLKEVAAALGVSTFHLAHVFREQTGTSMHKYLLRIRLEMARARILDGEPSLSRLALELGFSSHSHFTTMFREHFAASPTSIRERCGRAYSMSSTA